MIKINLLNNIKLVNFYNKSQIIYLKNPLLLFKLQTIRSLVKVRNLVKSVVLAEEEYVVYEQSDANVNDHVLHSGRIFWKCSCDLLWVKISRGSLYKNT